MDDFAELKLALQKVESILYKIRRENGIEKYSDILKPENCLGGTGSHQEIMQYMSDKVNMAQSHIHQIMR